MPNPMDQCPYCGSREPHQAPTGCRPVEWPPPQHDPEFKSGSDPGDCPQCAPFACEDPDRHLGVPERYRRPGSRCKCGAEEGGWDCMEFEDI